MSKATKLKAVESLLNYYKKMTYIYNDIMRGSKRGSKRDLN